MRRWLLVVLAVIGMTVGCVPSAPAQTTTPVASPLTDLQNWKQTIDTWKLSVADPAIAKINATPTNTDTTQLKSDLDGARSEISTMQTEIDDLTTRVTTAENKINTIGATSTTSYQSTDYGQGQSQQFTTGIIPTITTSSNGAVISQINVVSGNLQIASATTSNSQPIWYVQRLINYNTAIMYVRPIINIAQSSQYGWNNVAVAINSTTIAINSVQCSMTVSGKTDDGTIISLIGDSNTLNGNAPATAQYHMSVSPGLGYQTTSISFQPIKGCGTPSGELYLSPGGYMDITVQISGFTTSQSAFWTVTPSLSYHP